MGRYGLYQEVDEDLFNNSGCREVLQAMLEQQVLDQGLHPVGPMQFSWSRHFPQTVDPFPYLPRMQRLWIRLRLLPRPEPFLRQICGVRAVVEVAEHP